MAQDRRDPAAASASVSLVRSLVALVALSVGTPVGLAARPAPQQQSTALGMIIGTVSERGSLQPLAQALVVVSGTDRSVTTNARGQFRITKLAPGTRELEVTALGYRTAATGPVAVALDSKTRVSITMESEPLVVERLIVTAMKTARNSAEVAALTTVVDREDIDARGDVELVDALELAPGLMHTAQVNAFESIELRGMPREGNEFETTLLLIDGVPQTDSRNSARVINLPIDHADAVEVVNGPNSALYGRTALGGVINIITAQPTARPRVSADMQVGEFDHIRGAVRASGPLRDRAGYFLSWSSSGNGGFYSGDPAYDVDETSVFAKFAITPDDRSEAWISVNSVTSDNSLPTSVPVVNGELLSDIEPQFKLLDNINLPTANYHQEELRLTAHYTRDLGRTISFTNTASYRDIQYKFEESGDIIGAPFDLAAGTLTMYPFSLQSDEEIFYEEARFTVQPAGGRIEDELLVGASLESNTGFRRGDLIFTNSATFGMPIDFLDPTPPPRTDWLYDQFGGDRYRLRSYGLYYQYQIEPLPRILLTTAGRFDRLDLKNEETFKQDEPVSEETFEAFSPKFSALYRLLDGTETESLGRVNLNLYVAYSEAFKPPRSPSGLEPPGEDVNLEPEDITNYEAGLKSSFADGRASLQATYFQMERDGVVVSTQEGPFFRDSNAGMQDFEGLELAAAWAPRPNLSFHGNMAFYQNRFGDFVIQEESEPDVVLTGNRLPAVPDRIYNLGGIYEATDNLGFTLGFKYVGDRFSDQNNALILDSYTLFDGSISWSSEPVRFTLSGHNVFDKRYFTSGGSDADSVNPAAPRQLVFIVSYVYN
jgi:iron complex outermembrane receptor protein